MGIGAGAGVSASVRVAPKFASPTHSHCVASVPQLKTVPVQAEAMDRMFSLWRALAVLGDVGGAAEFDRRLVKVFEAGCLEVLREFEAQRSIDQLRHSHSGSRAVTASSQQPHVTAVTSLLSYGAQVVVRVLEERVPHAAKVSLTTTEQAVCGFVWPLTLVSMCRWFLLTLLLVVVGDVLAT